MTTSRLELRFKRAQEPLVIETRSSNKKQANANCAVLAVRELYKRGFIEKFGTRTENYDDEQVLSLILTRGPSGDNPEFLSETF